MKKIATLVALLLAFDSFAQQEAQFSQNMFNRLTVNPAFAGTSKMYCASLIYRTQWVNFPGAPKTAVLNLDAYLERWSSGVGLVIMNDRLGFEKTFLARGTYSFHRELVGGTLAFGAEGGIMQKSLNGNWVPPDNVNDAAIPAPSMSDMTFDAGLGAYFTNDNLYCGLSATQIPQTRFTDNTVQVKNVRHYYLMAGWKLQPAATVTLTPSVFVKSDAAAMQLDVNLIGEFRERFWGGASYRLTDAVVIMAGARQGNWKFGYAYDINTSALRQFNSNGHEIMLGYCFTKKSPPCHGHENVRRPSFKSPCE